MTASVTAAPDEAISPGLHCDDGDSFADVSPRCCRRANWMSTALVYPTPSAAAESVVGHKTNGWWFFLVDKPSRRSLHDIRRDYLDSLSEDVEADDEDDGDG